MRRSPLGEHIVGQGLHLAMDLGSKVSYTDKKREKHTTEEIVDLVGWEIYNNMFSLKVRSPEIYKVVLSKYHITDDESAVVNNFTDKRYTSGTEVVNVNFPGGLSEKNRHFTIKEILTCLMIG
jgi:hypothetical protein